MLNYTLSFKNSLLLRFIILPMLLLISWGSIGQNIVMVNGGNETACSGTFFDPGGTGNYAGGNNTYLHTICTANPGEYIQVNFTTFKLWEGSQLGCSKEDVLEVFDGPDVNSPLKGTYTKNSLQGQKIIGSSGCLTFRLKTDKGGGFWCSDNNGEIGWEAVISCLDELPATGENCFEAKPFCSDESHSFPNATSGSAPIGPNYGCLSQQPRPIWYYLKIGESGPIQIEISQSNGDIDFAMWGPFNDLLDGCGEVMSGNLAPLQCSYSISKNETIGIGLPGGSNSIGNGASTPPPAQEGEYYIVVMTNYDGASGSISLDQTGGDGTTDCSILVPCDITAVTAVPSACDDATNTFSVSGQVSFVDAPTTGTLIVEDCNGNTASYNAPFSSPINYIIENIPVDNSICKVRAYFSDETSCAKNSADYQNPASCECVPPILTINNLGICAPNSVDLNTAIHPSSVPANLTFYATQTDANNATNAINNIVNSASSYWVRAETAGNANCFSVYEISVVAGALPTVSAGVDLEICQGQTIILNGSGAVTYSWDNGVTNGVSFAPTATTVYTVTGTDANGCSNTDQVEITVNSALEVSFIADTLIGCEPLTVKFSNTSGVPGVTCVWNFGDGNTATTCNDVVHTYKNSGGYDVTLSITDDNGCYGTQTEYNYINVTSKPTASFSADPMVTGTDSPIVNFTNSSVDATQYTWDFGDNSPQSYSLHTSHTFPSDKEGDYIVTLVASNGENCSDTAKMIIVIEEELIFYIPNSFTPDNDGYNEMFQPVFTAGFDPLNFNMLIYNRWGEIVFESNDAAIGWKGTYGNKIAKDGVYLWKIEFKETKSDKRHYYQGHISLIR